MLRKGFKERLKPSGKGFLQAGRVLGSEPAASISGLVGNSLARPDVEVDMPKTHRREVKRKGGSMADAVVAAKSSRFPELRNSFRAKFFAASSLRSRQCKRSEVLKLARAVAGSQAVLPLSKDTVEGVATALKESGMKSGAQYLVELKLLHVEAGFEIEAWLKRAFDLCKKALERNSGPAVRALEVCLVNMEEDKLNASLTGRADTLNPGLLFCWASVWMLREVEARNMNLGHVTLTSLGKTVSIYLPTSKCDQAGKGIRRTLRCCHKNPCSALCPWRLAGQIFASAKAFHATSASPLFPTSKGARTSKKGNIKAWKDLWGDRISGHSPRRSGAMYYVRAGLPIQELAFLGRWRSNVVLTYAEEALQEKAVEVPELKQQVSNETPVIKPPMSAPSTPMVSTFTAPEMKAEAQDLSLSKALEKPRDLWVVTRGRGWKERPRHLVTKASWNLPISKWSTACGWMFAEKSSDFLFVAGATSDKLKCSKCVNLDPCATRQVECGLRMGLDSKQSPGSSPKFKDNVKRQKKMPHHRPKDPPAAA